MALNGIEVNLIPGRAQLRKTGYTIEEEEDIYDAMLQDVYDNPRWYLDNLPYLVEVMMSWVNYRSCNITKPYKYTENGKNN